MDEIPFKIRLRQVRDVMVLDYMTPIGRGRWSVIESRNLGPVPMGVAIANLVNLDLTDTPHLAAALVPKVT